MREYLHTPVYRYNSVEIKETETIEIPTQYPTIGKAATAHRSRKQFSEEILSCNIRPDGLRFERFPGNFKNGQ